MYLVDTNIFLEIFLDQEKSEVCKKFLNDNYSKLFISDFTLHSIGVILYRYKKEELFKNFISDIFPLIKILNLPTSGYKIFLHSSSLPKLDFDDLYQYVIAKYFGLNIVTMDLDFKKVKDIKIKFL